MYPRSFEYVAPASLDEAVSALKGPSFAKVMSGGMSLLPLMKMRLLSPDLVVDIGRINGLDAISRQRRPRCHRSSGPTHPDGLF